MQTFTSSKRDENSLFNLTRKFIKLLSEDKENVLNMTHASKVLGVGKRRIYDITNVLEGLGYVTKWSVNSVKWIGDNIDEILSSDANEEEIDYREKTKEEKYLDDCIDKYNKDIQEMSSNSSVINNAYVTYEDLENLKIFKNKLVFAIKAPNDTTMESPRYQKGSYVFKIMAEGGQISAYFLNER